MNKIFKFYSILGVMFAALLTYYGCSELEDNLVVAPSIKGAHPDGWIKQSSPNFHGKYFISNSWNIAQCRTCHGADYKGGSTGTSCYKCHTEQGGPEACNTCHGDTHNQDEFYPGHPYPPYSLHGDSLETDRGVGVHNHHLSPDSLERYSRQVQCSECHTPFTNFNDPEHIQPGTQGMARVTFGTLARTVTYFQNDTIRPNPSFDRNTQTCSNVYCHGYFGWGNRSFQPVFDDPESVVCGSCHGDPVSGNPNPGVFSNISPHFSYWTRNDCYLCHNQVINNQGEIHTPSRHINGELNLNQGDKP